MARRSLLRKLGKGSAVVLGCLALLVLVLYGVLQLQATRDRIAAFVSDTLSEQLQGTLTITHIGNVGGASVEDVSVVVRDDQGEVLRAEGLTARVQTLQLLRSLLSGGPLVVNLRRVEIAKAEVNLLPSPSPEAALRLQAAFAPVAPGSEAAPAGAGPSVFLHIDTALLRDVTVIYPSGEDAPGRVWFESLEGEIWLAQAFVFEAASPSLRATIPRGQEPFEGRLSVRGVAGQGATRIDLRELKGRIADATVDVRGAYLEPGYFLTATVETTAKAWSAFELPESLPAARFELAAAGDAEAVELSVRSDAPEAEFVLHSEVDYEHSFAAARAHVLGFQPGALVPGAPSGTLEGTIEVSADWSSEPHVVGRAELLPANVGGRPVPSLSVHGSLRWPTAEVILSTTECDCLELHATADLERGQARGALSLHVEGNDPNLAFLLERAGARVGRVDLDASAELDWQREVIDGEFDARVGSVRLVDPSIQVGRLDVAGSVRGSLPTPAIDLSLSARRLRTPEVEVELVTASAVGTPPDLLVAVAATGARVGAGLDSLELAVAGRVTDFDPVSVRDVALEVSRGTRQLRGRVQSISVGASVRVDNLKIDGPGTVRADLTLSPGGAIDAAVAADDLDLEEVSELLEPLVPDLSGRGSFVAEVHAEPGGEWRFSGNSAGFVDSVRVPGLELQSARWLLEAERSSVTGSVHVDLVREGGSVSLTARDVPVQELVERPLAEWANVEAGDLEVALDLEAEELNALLGVPPPLRLSGQLQAKLRLDSERGGQNRIELTAETVDLALQSVREGEVALERTPSPWEFERLNARLLARYHDGDNELRSWVRVSDRKRERLIAEANVTVGLPPGFPGVAPSNWETVPLEVVVRFARAPLDELPGGYLPRGTLGTVEGGAFLRGTLADPRFVALLDVEDFRVKSAYESFPVTFRFDARYGGDRAEVSAEVTHEGRKVATLAFDSPNVQGLLSGTPAAAYDARLDVDELPLGCFPYVRDYAVEGSVSAAAELTGSGAGPNGTIEVRAHELTALDVPFEAVKVDAAIEAGGAYRGRVALNQPDGEGRIEVRGKLPFADGGGALESARFFARNLEVAPARFALRDVLSELSGKLSGDVRVDLTGEQVQSRGTMKLEHGRAQIVALGQELHDVEAEVRALPGGDIHVDDISARAREGRVEGSLEVGYDWSGITRLEARVDIPNQARYPVVYQGLPLGDVSGTVELLGERTENGLALTLSTSNLDFYVEEQLDLELQTLGPSERVEVGSTTPDGTFIGYARDEANEEGEEEQGPPLEIRLGNDVWVHRGQGAFIRVEGDVVIESSGELRGQLLLPEGQIDVIGRTFVVDRGTITFREEEPANPVVLAEASWDSPSGYQITAEYRGPVSDGTLTLSSDPPLTQDQVLNVVLFDDPEGGFGGEDGGGGGGTATALATTVTTSGLGRALSDLSNLDISAGVDTSETGTARPEVGVRISPRWSIAVQYNPEGGSDGLSRHPDRALVSVRSRITSRWAVEGTVGDGGTSLVDLMWRYHY